MSVGVVYAVSRPHYKVVFVAVTYQGVLNALHHLVGNERDVHIVEIYQVYLVVDALRGLPSVTHTYTENQSGQISAYLIVEISVYFGLCRIVAYEILFEERKKEIREFQPQFGVYVPNRPLAYNGFVRSSYTEFEFLPAVEDVPVGIVELACYAEITFVVYAFDFHAEILYPRA